MFGNKVKELRRNTPTDFAQVWIRKPVDDKWFMLKNKANGRLLAAKDMNNTVVSGKSK